MDQGESGEPGEPRRTKELNTLKYHENLLKLMKETRDPQLYADLIREGAPVGILGVQATANILGQIAIKQTGPEVFPSDIGYARYGSLPHVGI